MTAAADPARVRWRILLLAALAVVLALLLPSVPASAAALPAAETRVGASGPATAVVVGVHECITAGQRPVRGPSQLQIALGNCVAAKSVTRPAAEDGAAAARGLSSHGGVLSSEANNAGGTVWTSTGGISQNDVAPLVNSGMYGGNVNVISGVHGFANGSSVVDASLYADDVARFGNLPGVSVFNLPELSASEITGLLRGPGTTIGAFCDSGACLAPFR